MRHARRQRLIVLAALALILLSTSAGAQVRWPTERPPEPLAARDVRFPPYEVRTLPNGLQVVTVLHHEQPAVSIRLLIRAGAVFDPPDKPGVATLVSALLDQGTVKRSAQEIADTIDYIGGSLNAGAGRDLSFVDVMVMKDSFTQAMQLVSEIARQPAFAAEEIERQRQQLRSGLQVSYEDPDYIASVVFDRLVYGFHPYGRPSGGTPESLAAIARADLEAFHRAYYVPNNAVMAIVGDVTAAEAFEAAQRIFGDWPQRELTLPPLAEPPAPTRRIVVVDKPGSVQTEIRIGHIGVPRRHDDYMALNLTTRILGGEGSNRLQRVLRSERGLTYSASADMNARKYGGDFAAETDTRSDATAEALRLSIEEFWRLLRNRVDPRELRDAQAYLAGSFPLTIETPDAIATQILNALFYGLDLKELETFRERVNAVRVDDIQRVAQTHLKPDRLSIVLVGDASTFETALRSLGFSEYERVPLSELDLSAVDLRKAPARPAQPARGGGVAGAGGTSALVPVAFAPGWPDEAARAVIARAVEAKGGLGKLASVKTVTARAAATLVTPQGAVEASTVTYIAYPDRFRVETTLPDGRIVQVYSRGAAWTDGPDGVHDAPAPVRDDFRDSVERDLLSLLIRAATGELQMRRLPRVVRDDRSLEAVELSAGDVGAVTILVDPTTGLVERASYDRRGPAGREAVEEIFGDYRPIDGLQVAHRAVVRRNGRTIIERVVTEFTYNTPVNEALFRRP